jgi:hypothetical protein
LSECGFVLSAFGSGRFWREGSGGLSSWLRLMFLMSRFQDKFKWMPTEGQLRSQYWYFKKSARKMREFLMVMQRMRGRDRGAKTEAQVVSKMKTGTLRPTW